MHEKESNLTNKDEEFTELIRHFGDEEIELFYIILDVALDGSVNFKLLCNTFKVWMDSMSSEFYHSIPHDDKKRIYYVIWNDKPIPDDLLRYFPDGEAIA